MLGVGAKMFIIKGLTENGQAFSLHIYYFLLRFNTAVTRLATITSKLPKSVRSPNGSEKTITPMMTLVIGSKVLRMDAHSPPIKNVLCWKRTTAPVVTSSEKRTHKPRPKTLLGKAKLFVTKHRIKVAMLLTKAI